ncbi:MAG: hypothetical protein HOW73_48380 [Polyangiaceae bacterium]|nr:hypothetical protein [Polyangiaceae bacterium]
MTPPPGDDIPPMGVVVSNIDPSEPAHVLIEKKDADGWVIVSNGTFTVEPRSSVTTRLARRAITGSEISAGGAYRITSNRPVTAYQINPHVSVGAYHSKGSSRDASLLLPVSAYGDTYIVPAWPYGPPSGSAGVEKAHVQIVAHAQTEVRVTSPVDGETGSTVPSLRAGETTTFCLQAGDYLQLTVKNAMDSFNGLSIEANHPVGVFSSNDCSNVPALWDAPACDHLEEQVLPVSSWGKEYALARVPQREGDWSDGYPPGLDGSVAIWQIMARDDDTTIHFNAAEDVRGLPESVALNAKEMVQYEVTGPPLHPGDFYVAADKPISVMQYMVGTMYDDLPGYALGDPSMVLWPPIERLRDSYVIDVPWGCNYNFLALVRERGTALSIDGLPVDATWSPVGTSSFEAARVRVMPGVHDVTGKGPFGVTVVGYDTFVSYAFPGGIADVPGPPGPPGHPPR